VYLGYVDATEMSSKRVADCEGFLSGFGDRCLLVVRCDWVAAEAKILR